MANLVDIRGRLLAGSESSGARAAHGPLGLLELLAAKEILGEVFDAAPREVEEMIRARIGGAVRLQSPDPRVPIFRRPRG